MRSSITDIALRSLWDWTTTIEFLASSVIQYDQIKKEDKLILGPSNASLVDSFNSHITRGRQPNKIHVMIARLARSMRSNLILTTNFDTLIEDSYHAQGEEIYMIPVSLGDQVPTFESARSQDTLVKLHGDTTSTRADSTINRDASPSDLHNFYSLLRGPRKPGQLQPISHVPSDLLVIGYSAGDARCVQMIKYVLENDNSFTCYWICYSDSDVDKVRRIFRDYLKPTVEPRFWISQTDRPDLFLGDLYHKINLALPGGGQPVAFNPVQIPYVLEPKKTDKKFEDSLKSYLKNRTSYTEGLIEDPPSHFLESHYDIMRGLCSESGIRMLWFELEDYLNSTSLLNATLTELARASHIMRHEWPGVMTVDTIEDLLVDKKRDDIYQGIESFVRKFKATPQRWLLVFYGRNGPGGCSGLPDQANNRYWADREYLIFKELRKVLVKIGFAVLYFPYSHNRADRATALELEFSKMFPGAPGKPLHISIDPSIPKGNRAALEPSSSWINKAIKEIIDKFSKTPLRKNDQRPVGLIWLHNILLFRQSRHPAALASEVAIDCLYKFNADCYDNDFCRNYIVFGADSDHKPVAVGGIEDALTRYVNPNDQSIQSRFRDFLFTESGLQGIGWMQWLKSKNFVLEKPGGFSWFYRDLRVKFVMQLNSVLVFINMIQPLKNKNDKMSFHANITELVVGILELIYLVKTRSH